MNTYNKQREWADGFHNQVIGELKSIFDTQQVEISTFEQDTKQACDYVVGKHIHISARLRDDFYRQRYPNDFTIRSRTKYNGESELSKILKGHGTYMFYGFINKGGYGIHSYKLIDLSIFRRAFECGNSYIHHKINNPLNNNDGTKLVAFDLTKMNSDIVTASECLHRKESEPTFDGWGRLMLQS